MIKRYSDFYAKYPGYNGDSGIPYPLPCEFALFYLNNISNGTFIDVGAHDGIAWSNSLIFEEMFGWKGICIEPSPQLFSKLNSCRKAKCLNCAVDSNEKEQIFWNITGSASGLSGLEAGFVGNHAERIMNELSTRFDSKLEK